MLQKILVVLVGMVMSLVGALSPSGLFASEPTADVGPLTLAGTAEETVATVRTDTGAGFAKVNILWAEVDGRRVTDDAWGTGTVDELRFQVGTKDVNDLALAVEDRLVPLRPTDVLTVRMFHGEFAFRQMGTSQATLQIQGSVKSALVNEGGSDARVRTEISGTPEIVEPPVGGAREVSYVVLTTGERVGTVAVEDGGARLVTESADARGNAENEAASMLAKWIKVDGKLLQEYTWGDGVVSTIEFEPAGTGADGVTLAYRDAPAEVAGGQRVVVKDFVGEYLVYQVQGGLFRLSLDGYAGDLSVGPAASTPVQTGAGAPIAAFDYTPTNPKTTDTIRFSDRSSDDTMVVLRLWRFGDEGTSVLPNPTYRFTKPGQYVVTLNVTDTDRQQSETSMVVEVANAEPVPDFDFWPKIVTTQTPVSFTDQSRDPDGSIVRYEWDFGDGTPKVYERNPKHTFATTGPTTVTLTTRDNLGGEASISKIVDVRNTPPAASFEYAPKDIETLVPVQFQDTSTDADGVIQERFWQFGDGANATTAAPTHIYQRPGLYTVSLTVTDDAGGSDTTTTQVFVRNRLPLAAFTWSPNGALADQRVHFTSLAKDLDGTILLHEWNFGDGTSAVEQHPSHVFSRAGTYNVTLTVTDNSLERNSTSLLVDIANAIPRVAISVGPNPSFRGAELTIADLTTDPDGDAIVERTWRIDDGEPIRDQQVIRRSFDVIGEHKVWLRVVDSAGSAAEANATFQIVNRPPIIERIDVTPTTPIVGHPISFRAVGTDMDAQPNDPPLTYTWSFSDGEVMQGEEVNRTFNEPIRVTATLRATDVDGDESNPLTTVANVVYAAPVASFVWSPGPPSVPATGQTITFESTSTSLNGPITSHRWDFRDGTTATGAVVDHVFTLHGTKFVELTVTDNRSRTSTIELPVAVNGRPQANFEFTPTGTIPKDTPVVFTDLSQDIDGDLVTAWQWNFGDGITSNEQHPVHNFTMPGRHNVTLTVTDARGATDTTFKTVRIENEPPVARFSAPSLPIAREPVDFADASYDPEGLPLVSWLWNFGDGTTSSLQSPSHTYANSGRYQVSLVVSDGDLQSRADSLSSRFLNVMSDHGVGVSVVGLLPDRREADLANGPYTVRARVSHVGGGFTDLLVPTPDGNGVRFDLGRGAWMAGDVVTVSVAAPDVFRGTLVKQWSLADVDGVSRTPLLEFEIPMPLVATIKPLPGDYATLTTTPFLVRNDNVTSEGDPVYRSVTEAFHGVGSVKLKDGVPVHDVTVVVEARYLPFRAIATLRDGLGLTDTTLLGWCRAAIVSTDTEGNYAWVMDHRSDCAFQEAGFHPVGRWEVRARTSFSWAESAVTDKSTVYVDPTGGFFWSAAAPP